MSIDHNLFCSIVIPAYNEAEMIEATLQSLSQQTITRDRYEIIVVDNGSTDGTPLLAKKYADLVLIKTTGNVGSVRNHGVKNSRSNIIVCTDADCLFDRDWLEKGLKLLDSNSNSVLGGGLKTPVSANWVEKKWLLNPSGKVSQQNSLMGSSIFIRKDHFKLVNGFDEFVTSGEDSKISETLTAGKVNILISPELSVIHSGGPKTLKDFCRRQVWHSENYLKEIKNSLYDKVFLLIVAFSLSHFLLLFSFILNNPMIFYISFSSIFFIPLVFSIKRMLRARYKPRSTLDFAGIYLLDLLYAYARSTGLIAGLKQLFKPHQA